MKALLFIIPLSTLLITVQGVPADAFLNVMMQMYPQTTQKVKLLTIKLQPEVQKAVSTFRHHADIAAKLLEPRFAKLQEQLENIPADKILREALILQDEVVPHVVQFVNNACLEAIATLEEIRGIVTEAVENTRPDWDDLLEKVGPKLVNFYRKLIQPELVKAIPIAEDIMEIADLVSAKYNKAAKKHYDAVQKDLGPLAMEVLAVMRKEIGHRF